ncbi:MAG: hypothetical protein AAF224_13025 [Pseudomonadota bacterium]
MGPVMGFIAGAATLGGAVALYRLAHRRAAAVRASIDEMRRHASEATQGGAGDRGALMDYEKDQDGVFRPKP